LSKPFAAKAFMAAVDDALCHPWVKAAGGGIRRNLYTDTRSRRHCASAAGRWPHTTSYTDTSTIGIVSLFSSEVVSTP